MRASYNVFKVAECIAVPAMAKQQNFKLSDDRKMTIDEQELCAPV